MAIHSSPKETLLLRSCISFGEECRSVNFWRNVISAMFFVPICQKPHPEISHNYHTLIRCLSTSHRRKITKLYSSSKFESCRSFLDECVSGILGSYIIPPGLLLTTCKRPHSKILPGYVTILRVPPGLDIAFM